MTGTAPGINWGETKIATVAMKSVLGEVRQERL